MTIWYEKYILKMIRRNIRYNLFTIPFGITVSDSLHFMDFYFLISGEFWVFSSETIIERKRIYKSEYSSKKIWLASETDIKKYFNMNFDPNKSIGNYENYL